MQTFFAESYLPANSISEITLMPPSIIFFTIGAVDGMPGLLMTSSALRMSSSECLPCSYGMSHSWSMAAYFSEMLPISERNTSNPFAFARTAEPTPLSPPPNTTTLDMTTNYLTLSNAIVMTASIIPTIQNLVTILASGSAFAGLFSKHGMPSFW